MSPLAPIALADRGITGEKIPGRLKSGDLIIGENLGFSTGNLVEKEGGSKKVNHTPLAGRPEILAGSDWWPDAATQREIVATSDGKLYKDNMTGAFATLLATGLGTGRVTRMIEGGGESVGVARKLFMPNGFDPVQVLSGDAATTHNLATPPADWSGTNQPTMLVNFRGVLVGAGNANFPHQLYASTGANHEDFTGTGSWVLPVYPGSGQRIVAGIVAFGRIWIWKYPTGIVFVEDLASAVSGWFAKQVSSQYGAAPTPHAIAQIDESVVAFVSNTGSIVLMQETAGSLTGVEFADLTKVLNLRDIVRDQFNLTRLNRIQVDWYDNRKQLHVLYAAANSVVENRRLVIDFNEERTRVSISTKDVSESLWFGLDASRIPRPRAGDNKGIVWKLDQAERTVDA